MSPSHPSPPPQLSSPTISPKLQRLSPARKNKLPTRREKISLTRPRLSSDPTRKCPRNAITVCHPPDDTRRGDRPTDEAPATQLVIAASRESPRKRNPACAKLFAGIPSVRRALSGSASLCVAAAAAAAAGAAGCAALVAKPLTPTRALERVFLWESVGQLFCDGS